MTAEEKKKRAVMAASKPATDVDKKTAHTAMETMLLKTLLFDAMQELNAARKEGRPMVIDYRVPCPCGKCNTKLSILISPYTSVYYDALRSKH